MREVVHVVIHPKFGGEVELDVGLGDCVEQFLFEGVAGWTDGVDEDVCAVEGASDAGVVVFGVVADGEFGAVGVSIVGGSCWWLMMAAAAALSGEEDDFREAVA